MAIIRPLSLYNTQEETMSRSLGAHSLGAIMLILCATTMQASIDVEGPQDSLAGAPTINHCTLRKAVINANHNLAAYPQCLSGVAGLDTIPIPAGMTITFALAGAD